MMLGKFEGSTKIKGGLTWLRKQWLWAYTSCAWLSVVGPFGGLSFIGLTYIRVIWQRVKHSFVQVQHIFKHVQAKPRSPSTSRGNQTFSSSRVAQLELCLPAWRLRAAQQFPETSQDLAALFITIKDHGRITNGTNTVHVTFAILLKVFHIIKPPLMQSLLC